jgi:amino acid adenylation domain-containing protein/thioester reductase-like protein
VRIIKQFLKTASQYENHIALEDKNQVMTYGELDRLSNYLASKMDVTSGQVIGLRFSKSVAYLVALFAVLKRGNPFVVLNTQLPEERLRYIKETLSLSCVIDELIYENLLEDFVPAQSYPLPSQTQNSSDLACIIFTSGSTGNPKGVKMTHRGLHNVIAKQVACFQLNPTSRFLFTNSISFDASLSDIFTTLLSGATLVLDPDNTNILEAIRKFNITHLDISPSLVNLIYRELPFDYLKTIVVGGELLSEQAIHYLCDRVLLVNAYGPTEATICCSMKVFDKGDAPNCIGVPIDGVLFHLDDGELIIESEACADGYYGIDSSSFSIENNKRIYRTGDFAEFKDGNYYFLGRKDRQVKIKGFRVELEEVESILKKESQIDSLAVVFKENKLACFSPVAFSKDIFQSVPYYMVPDVFIQIPHFKLTTNGKIDYHDLAEILKQKKCDTLLEVFTEVFDQVISPDDTWGSLGGDSLRLVSLIIHLEQAGLEFSVEDILSNTPIKQLAVTSTNTTELTTSFLKTTVEPCVFEDYVLLKHEKENVLITGAAGYLTSHLLARLLQVESNEVYTCLIRAASEQAAKNKLKETFNRYHLNVALLETPRLSIVLGDISKPRFGLGVDQYESLKNTTTKVIHCAAVVNNLLSYKELFDTNVLGTLEIIKLAKPIHYASTLSVFVGTDKNSGTVYESDDLSDIQKAYGGYAQSKFMAEYLLRASKLPFVCYRFGLLTGHTKESYANPKEFITMLFKGLENFGCLPDIDLKKMVVDISPVDFAVEVMADIYLQSDYNQTYHIANNKGASLQLIYDTMQANGCEIALIPKDKFKQKIFDAGLNVNTKSLLLTLCRFDDELFEKYRHCDLFQRGEIEFDMKETLRLCQVNYPPVNQALLAHYFSKTRSDEYVQ